MEGALLAEDAGRFANAVVRVSDDPQIWEPLSARRLAHLALELFVEVNRPGIAALILGLSPPA